VCQYNKWGRRRERKRRVVGQARKKREKIRRAKKGRKGEGNKIGKT
jgi:hypothetical protein